MTRAPLSVTRFLVACSTPVSLAQGQVGVRALPPTLQVTNHTSLPVFTFIIESGAAARTDWLPCRDPVRCAAIAPGATATVPYTEIKSYSTAAREAIVYWWHLVPTSGGFFQPDSIQAQVVAL